MVYESELYAPLEIGKSIPAYVRQVLVDDGKIDLVLSGSNDGRVDALMHKIVKRLEGEPGCFLPISDSASPGTVRATFQCSKKDFKKAIGHLSVAAPDSHHRRRNSPQCRKRNQGLEL